MNSETIESLIKQLKAAGLDDEKIMDVFYTTFKEGKMDRSDLEILAEYMGYELTDEFKNDPEPDPIAGGAEKADEDGISKEDAEAAKALEPGETKEEFKEKIDDMKSDDDSVVKVDDDKKEESTADDGKENSDMSDDDKDDDKDDDWEKAQKMFKI